jgi:hypothetical protein
MNAPKNSAPVSPAIRVPAEVVELVRGPLAPKNSVAIASIDFYVAALAAVGVDPESLSFAETVEVTRRLYAPSADFRRDRAEVARAEKAEIAAKAKADREAKAAKRELEEIEILKAKLAAKGISL